MTYYNWNKALQNQTRAQNKPQGKPDAKQRQQGKQRDGFDDEWVGKDVEVEQAKGVIRGRVVDVSKYWLKIIVNGEVVYLNKAYIVSIKPTEMKDGGVGVNVGK
jgi:hypothetical protein